MYRGAHRLRVVYYNDIDSSAVLLQLFISDLIDEYCVCCFIVLRFILSQLCFSVFNTKEDSKSVKRKSVPYHFCTVYIQ